ncbi:MAG TPA: hypothetical protein VFK90_03085 [Anaeromyxobacter sp.]|jgi:hypothetical protein|nr:hypothetical protein [Anaeromyxobacter sp.]
MSETVLQRLELLLREDRERGDDRPRERARKVFVDPGGRIRIGDTVPENEGPGLSEIHPGVFAAPGA